MRPLLLTFLTLFVFIRAYAGGDLDLLYRELDGKIENNRIFCDLKESRIEAIKREAFKPGLSAERSYELHSLLYDEYRNYVSDSAIFYMNRTLDIAHALGDSRKINRTSIDQTLLFSRLGMYIEAQDMLASVRREHLDHQQLVDYYIASRSVYASLASYTQNNKERGRYRKLAHIYRDSMMTVAAPDSEEYLRMEENMTREGGNLLRAMEINDRRIAAAVVGTPQYALVAFHRSLIYRAMNDTAEEQKYLILSAISDIQSTIRDNASIPLLANILVGEGDIDRAYRYMKYSLDNIILYNTRIRSSEIINIQKIIDEAYHQKNEEQRRMLQSFLILTAVLSVMLTGSVFWVYKQMRRSVAISKRLEETNAELISLNKKLHDMNNELQKINLEVTEANYIKEEYISYFLGECLKYIDKMDALRRMAAKKLRDRRFDDLLTLTRSDIKEEELRLLHNNFDTMFIHLFPDFVDKFNSLLLPEEQIVLKKGETLNVELRVYALIRLGIDDSCKIAGFLGYSVNTIYNYRTKVKNKARIARGDFEWMVKRIGTFSRE